MRFICFVVSLMLTSHGLATMTPRDTCTFNGVDFDAAMSLMVKLQIAVEEHAKDKIANFFRYPIRVYQRALGDKIFSYQIQNKREFQDLYEEIFNPHFSKRILKTRYVTCSEQGAMIGNGALWLDTSTGSGRVITIDRALT